MPTPPVPVSVTSRADSSSRVTSAISRSRPMKLVERLRQVVAPAGRVEPIGANDRCLQRLTLLQPAQPGAIGAAIASAAARRPGVGAHAGHERPRLAWPFVEPARSRGGPSQLQLTRSSHAQHRLRATQSELQQPLSPLLDLRESRLRTASSQYGASYGSISRACTDSDAEFSPALFRSGQYAPRRGTRDRQRPVASAAVADLLSRVRYAFGSARTRQRQARRRTIGRRFVGGQRSRDEEAVQPLVIVADRIAREGLSLLGQSCRVLSLEGILPGERPGRAAGGRGADRPERDARRRRADRAGAQAPRDRPGRRWRGHDRRAGRHRARHRRRQRAGRQRRRRRRAHPGPDVLAGAPRAAGRPPDEGRPVEAVAARRAPS